MWVLFVLFELLKRVKEGVDFMLELFEVEIVCCGFEFVMMGVVIVKVLVNCLDLWWLFLDNMVGWLIG